MLEVAKVNARSLIALLKAVEAAHPQKDGSMFPWTMPATIMPRACVNGSSNRDASACCTSSRPIVLTSIHCCVLEREAD